MDQFKFVFDKTSIFRTMFFSIKAVTEYNSIQSFQTNNPNLYQTWASNAEKRYDQVTDDIYLNKGCYLPELCEIKSISFGFIFDDNNGGYRRELKVLENEAGEAELIKKFFGIVEYHSSKVANSYLCGHNILGYDIPFLIKRAMKHKIRIPEKFKTNLVAKPWENSVIDTVNLWKFTGSEYISLNTICTFLNLKYKTLPLSIDQLSVNYHRIPPNNNQLKYEANNQVNLTIQLYKELMNL